MYFLIILNIILNISLFNIILTLCRITILNLFLNLYSLIILYILIDRLRCILLLIFDQLCGILIKDNIMLRLLLRNILFVDLIYLC
jgi:hypothetical protein